MQLLQHSSKQHQFTAASRTALQPSQVCKLAVMFSMPSAPAGNFAGALEDLTHHTSLLADVSWASLIWMSSATKPADHSSVISAHCTGDVLQCHNPRTGCACNAYVYPAPGVWQPERSGERRSRCMPRPGRSLTMTWSSSAAASAATAPRCTLSSRWAACQRLHHDTWVGM